jgi:hypothetical protein
MKMTETTQEIDIPQNALTTCPLRQFMLVSIARVCVGCQYHQGFFDTTPDEAAFNIKYRVSCGIPQSRDIFIAALNDEDLDDGLGAPQ